jgi:branched-chain amino acid transport system permease protein
MILPQVVNGFCWGMILGLIALGLNIVFGMLNIINFAHGAFYAVSVYLAFTLANYLHIPGVSSFWGSLIIVPIIMGLFGILIERVVVRPMLSAKHEYQLLLTFSILLILQEGIAIVWGTVPRPFNCPDCLVGIVDLKFMVYPIYRLFAIALTMIIIAALWYFLEKTKFGSILRGGIEDGEMMRCLGINISVVRNLTFGLGIALAALGGVVSAPITGSLNPHMGMTYLITCFVIISLGGLGSFEGAVIGGILIGIMKSVMIFIEPKASEVSMYILMAAVILVRPRGLFGKR